MTATGALLAIHFPSLPARLQPWPPAVALVAPFVAGLLLMPLAIGLLARAGMGQRVRAEGPAGHAAKEGTPTAGGLGVIALVLLTVLLIDRRNEIAVLLAALLLGGGFGLVDDVLTVRTGGRWRGLPARQRIFAQLTIGVVLAVWLLQTHHDGQQLPLLGTWHMGWLLVPLAALAIAASANAFNLTDGSDGLAPGVMVVVLIALAFMARGPHQVAVVRLLLASAGAMVAFLAYNLPPARVFLGGVGAEGLGTMIGAASVSAGLMWFLPLVAIVPLAEVVSVVIQVAVFRRSGRRVFRMAPIHHHFQLGGWSEFRVAITAWLTSGAAGAIGLLLVRKPA